MSNTIDRNSLKLTINSKLKKMKKELNLTGLEIFQLINSYKCSQIELEGMCFKKVIPTLIAKGKVPKNASYELLNTIYKDYLNEHFDEILLIAHTISIYAQVFLKCEEYYYPAKKENILKWLYFKSGIFQSNTSSYLAFREIVWNKKDFETIYKYWCKIFKEFK